MFKKKPNLPPRPTFPSTEEIISDLMNAANDDPLFETLEMVTNRKLKSENIEKEDAIYHKINKLFKSHDELRKNVQNLNSLSEKLDQKRKSMLELSDDLKNKALKALV